MRILALTLLTTSLVPAVAWPCGNAVYLDTQDAAKLVARAEGAMKKGNYSGARALLSDEDVQIADASLRQRRVFLLAVADVRLGSVERGVTKLRGLSRMKADDPEILTRLGEGLAKLPKGAGEALQILGRLEEDDLMVDAMGYLALAKLRMDGGDTEGAERALERCKRIDSGGMCILHAPRPAKPSKLAKQKTDRHS